MHVFSENVFQFEPYRLAEAVARRGEHYKLKIRKFALEIRVGTKERVMQFYNLQFTFKPD